MALNNPCKSSKTVTRARRPLHELPIYKKINKCILQLDNPAKQMSNPKSECSGAQPETSKTPPRFTEMQLCSLETEPGPSEITPQCMSYYDWSERCDNIYNERKERILSNSRNQQNTNTSVTSITPSLPDLDLTSIDQTEKDNNLTSQYYENIDISQENDVITLTESLYREILCDVSFSQSFDAFHTSENVIIINGDIIYPHDLSPSAPELP